MIDKLQGNLPPGYTRAVSSYNGVQSAPQEQNQIVHSASAEVSLSDKAKFLQQAVQAVKDAPDVRYDVVERIKDQVQAGTYQINSDRLVERLLPLFD